MDHYCIRCNERFKPTRGKQRFCSRSCSDAAISGPSHPNYKGGTVNVHGYRILSVRGRIIAAHRWVMEQHLGRRLTAEEVVHHINHDRLDNRIENLELKPSNSDHVLSHYSGFRTETHKQCKKCHVVKPRDDFERASRKGIKPDSHHTQCKQCRAAYRRELRRRRSVVAIEPL